MGPWLLGDERYLDDLSGISERVARSMPQSSAVFVYVCVRARACMYLGSGACRVLNNKQLRTSNFFSLSDALSEAAKRSGAQT
jgi:signal transduction histidine kinase